MARTIDTIVTSIKKAINADPVLSAIAALVNAPVSNMSKRQHANLWVYIMGSAQNKEEQLMDEYIAQNEKIVAMAPAANSYWLQGKMFEFQYDATTPQIIQLQTADPASPGYLSFAYPVVDANKRIITRCSVKKTLYKTVEIKIAKGNPAVKCASGEVTAAQDYIDIMGNCGANYVVTSQDPDLLFIDADIYFKGQYSAVILANVKAALSSYITLGIQSTPESLDGKIKLLDMEMVIRTVPGVTDVVLKNVAARAAATLFADKYYLVNDKKELDKQWVAVAGYVVEETTSGSTWTDTLNFIPE